MLDVQIVVMAKAPVAGRSKTRLCPPLLATEAAEIAEAALLDTLDAVAATPVTHRVVVLDGSAGVIPAGFVIHSQSDGSLEMRLAAAVTEVFAARPLPMLLIGMDTPQVIPTLLREAAEALVGGDSVLGLAADGGWWAIGLRSGTAEVFRGVPMSQDDTGSRQLEQMSACGLNPTMLPVLRDIDTADDLAEVASLMPSSSRVGAAAARLLTPTTSEQGRSA